MIHLALQTEFSFKQCYLPISDIHKYVVDGCVGIADLNNTFGHIALKQEAEKHGFKPIYGVRLHVVPVGFKERVCHTSWIFIAADSRGLKALYKLVERAYDNFYYMPKITREDIDGLCENIHVISPEESFSSDYTAIGPGYRNNPDPDHDAIALVNNRFPLVADQGIYELIAGARKNGESYSYMYQDQTYSQHIMSEVEWLEEYKDKKAIQNTYNLAKRCNADIPQAGMIKWEGRKTIKESLNINKWSALPAGRVQDYVERLEYEIGLIEEKGYTDYFLIVADMIRNAKKTMFVGPARGSSAGSLICYLLDITDVDPIKHDLIFERFIDVNRFDLPDIDIDFPDAKRDGVIKYLRHKYGSDNVQCLSNINRFKAKSAIDTFAKGLGVAAFETEDVKGAIIERASGDARAGMCILDTFTDTDEGRAFIEKYPDMVLVEKIENHASHAGKHAAGILVSTEPLCTYGAINSRDQTIMMDKKQAEYLGLLKIDCLGLRTLSVLEGVADQIKMPYGDYNKLPLDDPKVFDLLGSRRVSGIFQFEGEALEMLVKQMEVKDFGRMVDITALARPGALNSGGTARYIRYARGEGEPHYYSDDHKRITGDTFGIVVYQEQMMNIAREIGGLSWADTSTLRRAASKSMGDEFFGQFKDKFLEGAIKKGYGDADSDQLWTDISASGSWSFNKSHAVSYGLISYWCCWSKSHYPMEFAVACLNTEPDPESAIKLLRDMKLNDGIDNVPVDPDLSGLNWTHTGGKLIGGLTNIKGIGKMKAQKIINARKGKGSLTPALYKALLKPETPYDILFPADHYWGNLYRNPAKYGMEETPVTIDTIEQGVVGTYCFLGKLTDRNIRNLNEQVFLTKRDGQIIESNYLYLNLRLGDDTGIIKCSISRWKFESIGREIAERGKLGVHWYLAKGRITGDWRKIDIDEIVNLNQYFPKGCGGGIPE